VQTNAANDKNDDDDDDGNWSNSETNCECQRNEAVTNEPEVTGK
jgi:hypothetical protein